MSRGYGGWGYGYGRRGLGSPEVDGRVAGCGGGQMVGAPRGGGGHGGGRGGWGWGGNWGYGYPYGYGGYGYGNGYGYGGGNDGSTCTYDQRTGRYVCYVYDPARGGWTIVG